MRVTILAVGSRGDVQPYAAIARGLLDAGHDVTFATHARFQWLADELSVPMRGLTQDPLLAYSRLVDVGTLRRPREAWLEVKRGFFTAMDEWDSAVEGADLLVAHSKMFVAVELAARHGARVAFAHTLPASCPTAEYPCCYVLGRPSGPVVNRLSYSLLPAALVPLQRWAVAWLEARGAKKPARLRWDLTTANGSPVSHLHGHSQVVLPAPKDWPREWLVTGYWRVGPPDAWQPDPELSAFLAAGPAPVYVGFGSMVYRGDRKHLARDIVRSILERGDRALLVRGWALDDAEIAGQEGVHFMDAYEGTWHSWLFDRVKAVVHHGGPGTFGAALHAGRPQVCCPFSMDQPFWAHRAEELGVAPPALPVRRWSAEQWAARLGAALDHPTHAERAADMALRLAGEDGVGVAVEVLERIAEGPLPVVGRRG